jgi:hypothetical protein
VWNSESESESEGEREREREREREVSEKNEKGADKLVENIFSEMLTTSKYVRT